MDQTLADLKEDLSGLARLAESCGARVWKFKAALEAHPYVGTQADGLWNDARELARRLAEAGRGADAGSSDPAYYRGVKREGAELLRVLYGKLGFVLSALDWQSPSFKHSLRPLSGKQEGQIVGTENDYKRDIHLDASEYERAFTSAYVDAPWRFIPAAYATSSGMSAMTTVVGLLQLIHGVEGPILVGRGCYFENQWILERAFRGRVHVVDEHDAERVIAEAERLKPRAIFLDSLCNTQEVALPNLPILIPALARILTRDDFLVIDNTGLACSFQPLRYFPRLATPRLLVIESLNKHHQFGMDRVTGGIIWTQGGLPSELMRVRERLGTNIPDASVLALPQPDRTLLDRRLARLGRNARTLATRLSAQIGVAYPCLPSHPAYAWAKDYAFQGSFFALSFPPHFRNTTFYASFIARIIEEAARQNVQIVAGTSFGLDTTRVYLTALYADGAAEPFVRVAVGTETAGELEGVARVFEIVLTSI